MVNLFNPFVIYFCRNDPSLIRFLKSAFLISAGGALTLMSGLVLLIPYTENLRISDYGELAIYISFSMLVQYLMNFGIDTYLSVHYYDHSDEPALLKKFVSSVFGLLLLMGLLIIVLFSIAGSFLFDSIFKGGIISFFPFGFMSVITAFFNAFFRTYVNVQVFANKAVKYFLFGLFNFIVTVVISTILVYQYPHTIIGPMWGRLLSGVLIFILTLLFTLKDYGITFNKTLIPEIKKFCMPLLIFNLLTWVLAYFNNYILNAFETTADVGVYDFALKCTLFIEFAGLGLLGTINPRVFQLWKKNDLTYSTPEENRYYHVFSGFNILFIAINILLLPLLIRLFINNEGYYYSIDLLPVLCVSFVFRGLYNAFTNPIYYFKQTKVLPKVLLITAVVQVVSGIILIRFFGIWGAVLSYFIVRPVQVFFMWLESRKVFDFRFNVYKMFVIPLVYAASVILIYQLPHLTDLLKGILQLIIAIIMVGFLYFKEIRSLPDKWKRE